MIHIFTKLNTIVNKITSFWALVHGQGSLTQKRKPRRVPHMGIKGKYWAGRGSGNKNTGNRTENMLTCFPKTQSNSPEFFTAQSHTCERGKCTQSQVYNSHRVSRSKERSNSGQVSQASKDCAHRKARRTKTTARFLKQKVLIKIKLQHNFEVKLIRGYLISK